MADPLPYDLHAWLTDKLGFTHDPEGGTYYHAGMGWRVTCDTIHELVAGIPDSAAAFARTTVTEAICIVSPPELV